MLYQSEYLDAGHIYLLTNTKYFVSIDIDEL